MIPVDKVNTEGSHSSKHLSSGVRAPADVHLTHCRIKGVSDIWAPLGPFLFIFMQFLSIIGWLIGWFHRVLKILYCVLCVLWFRKTKPLGSIQTCDLLGVNYSLNNGFCCFKFNNEVWTHCSWLCGLKNKSQVWIDLKKLNKCFGVITDKDTIVGPPFHMSL